MVALTVDADDEHGTTVSFADRLAGSEVGWRSALRRAIAEALAEAAMAELIRASEKLDGKICVVGGESWLHGAEMLVTKGKDVGPHRKRV